MEIIYFQMFSESYTYNDIESIQGSFNIDQTLGREVAFEISYNIPGDAELSFHVTYPNETLIDITKAVYLKRSPWSISFKYSCLFCFRVYIVCGATATNRSFRIVWVNGRALNVFGYN